MARIKIKIDSKGNPTILDVCGAGTNCQASTKNFEAMLGTAKEESRALTESYFEEQEVFENELKIDGDE